MTYQEIQQAIVACVPSGGLREAVTQTGHVFAPQELLLLAYRYAPEQAKQLELLTLLAQSVPEIAAHAQALLRYQGQMSEAYMTPSADAAYELLVDEKGVSEPERYLCASHEAALARLRWYREEYADIPGGEEAYSIVKRRILSPGDDAKRDNMGWCRVDAQGRILSLSMYDEGNEWGGCPDGCDDCDECPRVCMNSMEEAACPMFIGPWDFVRYRGWAGWTEWGIAMPPAKQDPMETVITVYRLDGKTVHCRDMDDAFCSHNHVALPEVEVVTVEELPSAWREAAVAYRAWLKTQIRR